METSRLGPEKLERKRTRPLGQPQARLERSLRRFFRHGRCRLGSTIGA
jgi:hypothetical protein